MTRFVVAAGVALLAGPPFWETKPAAEWSPEEVQSILDSSPWAQLSRGRSGELRMFLATAKPMQEAEQKERLSKRMRGANDSSHEEYLAMIREAPDQYVVLAVAAGDRETFSQAGETSRIETDSRLFSGKNQSKPITYFPPSSSDPYLRIVFPRTIDPKAKTLEFAVFVPGQTDPFRRILFPVNKMMYRGKLEF